MRLRTKRDGQNILSLKDLLRFMKFSTWTDLIFHLTFWFVKGLKSCGIQGLIDKFTGGGSYAHTTLSDNAKIGSAC